MRGTARWIATTMVLALVLGACGEGDGVADGGEQQPAPAGESTNDDLPPFCDDIEIPRPVELGSEPGSSRGQDDFALHGVLATYLSEHEDTAAGMWIDRVTGGFILAFTDDPAAHREAILARRASPDDIAVVEPRPEITETTTVAESGVPIGVVQVRWSEAELEAVASQMHETLADQDNDIGLWGGGIRQNLNRLSLNLRVADEETRAALAELLPADAICVEGPAERPQPVDPASVDLLPDDEADPLVRCDGYPFRRSALDAPLNFEDADHPIAEALRHALASNSMGIETTQGWRLLAEDDRYALVAHGDPIDATMNFERLDGTWVWAGSSAGGCEVLRLAMPERISEVRWGLDPEHDAPGPADTQVAVVISEMACTGGQPVDDRLIGPQIRYTDDEIIVGFGAVPLEGGAFTCPGNPPTRLTIELDEPLGDRSLVDAFDAPPRRPVTADPVW